MPTAVMPVGNSSAVRPTQEQPPALSETPNLQLWHYRLHRPEKELKKLKTKTTDMVIVEDKICTGCAEGDMQALRHKKSERRHETEVGALVYSDVFGPYPYPSLARHRYFVVFLDDASGYIATFFLRNVLSSALTEALNDYVTLLGKT